MERTRGSKVSSRLPRAKDEWRYATRGDTRARRALDRGATPSLGLRAVRRESEALPTRAHLRGGRSEYLGYHDYEQKLDELFAQGKNR